MDNSYLFTSDFFVNFLVQQIKLFYSKNHYSEAKFVQRLMVPIMEKEMIQGKRMVVADMGFGLECLL